MNHISVAQKLRAHSRSIVLASVLLVASLALPLPAVVNAEAASASAAQPSFYLNDCHANETVNVGQVEYANCTVGTDAVAAKGIIVELNIYNSLQKRVSHQVYTRQMFAAYSQHAYASTWTPKHSGTYTFQVSVLVKQRTVTYIQQNINTITVVAAPKQ